MNNNQRLTGKFVPPNVSMPGLRRSILYFVLGVSVALMFASSLRAAAIRFSDHDAELVISQVSERTVRIQLSPLDDNGRPVAPKPQTDLALGATSEKWRGRNLAGSVEVSCDDLKLSVEANPLKIVLHRKDGSTAQTLLFDSPSNGVVSFHADAPVFGLGEGAPQLDRRGGFYPMVNGQIDPWLATIGATIPVPFLIGVDGWSMFINEPWGKFDLREGSGKFLPTRASIGTQPIDIFLSALSEPAQAMQEYIRLTGKPLMPPKWVMGYIQSHRTLSGPEEPLRIAQTFREKKLPCDAVIYLGTGYCTNGWNLGHGSLEFNPHAFDHPAEQIAALHDLHYKVILHINHAPRDLFGNSIDEKSDSPIHISNYWKRHLPDMALGVDGWWPDDGDELPIEARLARHRCYYEGPVETRPNARPWSLHRNAYAGAQRYGGWIWSGDVQSRWATLAAHIASGLNCSVSLTPFWGTDTGGFIPTREFTGELYTRWFQFSAFNPLFRSHGRTWHLRLPWGWDTGETGPVETRLTPDPALLHNAEVEPICRKYLDLRYQLLPYNYTLMREACDTGLPPMRALWIYYSSDSEAVDLKDEYLWGRDFLVAPVVEPGAKSRRLYLPEGDWFDWWTGEQLHGKRWIERPVDLATMPLYVRAGAIIPFDPARQYTGESVSGVTTLKVFPGADGSFTLYDDDGQSLDYQKPSDPRELWLHLQWDDRAHALTMTPDKRMPNPTAQKRVFQISVEGAGKADRRITFSGQTLKVLEEK